MIRPPLASLAVVVALAVGAVLAGSNGPAPQRSGAVGDVPIVGATAVCPDLRQGAQASRASVGVDSQPDSAAMKGTLDAARVTGTGPPLAVPPIEPGQVAVDLGGDVQGDGIAFTATGRLAAGLQAEQVSRADKGPARGLAGLRCDAPRTDAWFEGGGSTVMDSTVLVLADVDSTPSQVDVTAFTGTGPVDARPGRGITVPPHGRVVLNMDTLAPDRSLLAVHVASRRGRFAAGLLHSQRAALVSLGQDWVPQAQPPAVRVVVPGLPQGPGVRAVRVTNPGSDDTVVRLQVTTADGQFVPNGLDSVAVPAGTTVERRLDTLTAASALTVTVTSDGAPVLAGAVVVDADAGSPAREFCYTTGALPLSGPALLTDLGVGPATSSTLILTAPQEEATVVVTPLTVLGARGPLPAAKTVLVPAGRTTTVPLSSLLPAGATARLALEVRPAAGSGPVYAARYLRERAAGGPLTTLLVLRGPAQQVARPVVVRDPAVGAGG